ncbi:MAG TPA: OmpA family protein [Spirochaetota bacterium]|mgnify:CR=1 FL=1|nr:OmpA family protein [Spirochaetota bacterium]HPC39488.1 OmpA family protein [Spirochaetota bacterium]HPL16284.1 OmpA family protein [Spirochaetota bacterium]HQF06825.1 OmpA family protein [Spirochaetota bacterium]HQH95556.1 OmpA family protein [Spirochaetota bacterium]
MKKILIFLFMLGAGVAVSFLLYTDMMMVQLPVLIQKNPKITFVLGNASYRKTPSDQWEQAIVGQTLKPGYEVKTEKNSQMDICFHGNMAVRVSENSMMRIDDMSVRKVMLKLNNGSLYGKFEKIFKDYDIKVKTPTTVAAIRGTELGFEIHEDLIEMEKLQKKIRQEKKKDEEPAEVETLYSSTIYSVSGIAELNNPKFEDQKVLLSYQNKIAIKENEPPSNPEKMTDDEISRMRSILNSIHTEEVLFISDKINFEVNSATIIPHSYAELDKIIKIIKEKNVRVRIEGHTDIQGTASFNQTLSIKRAESIKKYLVQKGIEADHLEIAGYGSSKPVASNTTPAGRSLNRRVEFIIIE